MSLVSSVFEDEMTKTQSEYRCMEFQFDLDIMSPF